MPEVKISLDEEQKLFDADVAAIEKQWSSPRQAHLKRYVLCCLSKVLLGIILT
jgi:hypothetical protein